jgi:hypothetical protein
LSSSKEHPLSLLRVALVPALTSESSRLVK